MPIQHINPVAIHNPAVYTHAVGVSDATVWYLAGQVAFDKDGKLVGEGDLAAQLEQSMHNLRAILADINADLSQIVKLTIYIVDYEMERDLPLIGKMLTTHFDNNHPPANTLIGVQTLARPGLRAEIEAIVAVEN
ncbi:MAG: RidA family protein [Aggregatilineales bacterium]